MLSFGSVRWGWFGVPLWVITRVSVAFEVLFRETDGEISHEVFL